MDPEKAEKLKKGFFQLTHNMLCADKAAQYLYANKQLSVQLRDQIREQENNTEKNRLLLNNVLCRDTKGQLVNITCRAAQYPRIQKRAKKTPILV